MKSRVFSALSLVLSVFMLVSCGGEEKAEKKVPSAYAAIVGKSLDGIDFYDMNGERVLLKNFVKPDTPVVLNLWATWCPPCLRELPSLYELGLNEDISVITVAVDRQSDTVDAFLTENHLPTLVVLSDPMGEIVREAFGVKSYPVTFILDKGMNIRAVEEGEREWNHPKMADDIRNLVKS